MKGEWSKSGQWSVELDETGIQKFRIFAWILHMSSWCYWIWWGKEDSGGERRTQGLFQGLQWLKAREKWVGKKQWVDKNCLTSWISDSGILQVNKGSHRRNKKNAKAIPSSSHKYLSLIIKHTVHQASGEWIFKESPHFLTKEVEKIFCA